MSDTITSFITFQASTPARSSEMNTNFSAFRGDLIPVNENTQTASDLTHNLGTGDHRWVSSYIKRLIFSDQTTSGLYMEGSSDAQKIDFYIGNTLSVQLDNRLLAMQDTTTTFSSSAGTAVTITGLFLSVTSFGTPVFVSIYSESGGYFRAEALTTSGDNPAATLSLFRDATLVVNFRLDMESFHNAAGNRNSVGIPLSLFYVDNSATGDHVYSCTLNSVSTDYQASIVNARMIAYTLFS